MPTPPSKFDDKVKDIDLGGSPEEKPKASPKPSNKNRKPSNNKATSSGNPKKETPINISEALKVDTETGAAYPKKQEASYMPVSYHGVLEEIQKKELIFKKGEVYAFLVEFYLSKQPIKTQKELLKNYL